ncbi:MAG: DUF4149 domain-containing protein [Ectothiorhodospiraceae bacterium]|nr:DUF4149 domain-containing protein [Ectothiorhodospiraceae bacterium]
MSAAIERLLVTLWVGSVWAIGYIAAPALFANLDDSELAGRLAGELFTATAWVGMGCAVVLLMVYLVQRGWSVFTQWRFWLVLVMLALTVVGEFVIRAQMELVRGTESFARLHGTAQLVFLVVALLGLALVLAGPAGPRRRRSIFA